MKEERLEFTVEGKPVVFTTGALARQANGSVLIQVQDTMILSTACGAKTSQEGIDFFPLRIDYQEKFSAAGKTPGGFMKREGKPTERETLTCRLIDRPIRPLFPRGYFNEVQVQNTVLSYDPLSPPEPWAICGAACALLISDIPFAKPLAAVRVGQIDGEFVINPTSEEMEQSTLDLVLAGTEDAILMIEGYCDFLTDDEVVASIERGHGVIRHICQQMKDWQALVGKDTSSYTTTTPSEKLLAEVRSRMEGPVSEAFTVADKKAREEKLSEIHSTLLEELLSAEDPEYSSSEVSSAVKATSSTLLREKIFAEKRRIDGRGPEDIRPIVAETGKLPRAHGSAIFTRGETQAICVCTLGGESMGQRYETLEIDSIRKFYLQYSFPSFSVGEVGRVGPPGRREIGHGKLAERALSAVVPTAQEHNFPYTIRLESNITESNGSSSMASVCGGCLALMDAGIAIKKPVSGIAMGLLLQGNDYLVLSDILGIEDALGDMDFKITGDDERVTAFQMDIKVEGITSDIMRVALHQARQGRAHILQKMHQACPEVRPQLSQYAPRIETMTIKPSKIAVVIGPGGKMIRSIIEETGVELDISDEGIVNIASTDAAMLEKAKAIVKDLTSEPEIGQIYKGSVVSIQPFGAFVKIVGAKEGLVHISEISKDRVENVEDHLSIGDQITVKVLDINGQNQIRLSMRAVHEKPGERPVAPAGPRPGRRDRSDSGGRRDRAESGGGRPNRGPPRRPRG